jgi:hypothetical protein
LALVCTIILHAQSAPLEDNATQQTTDRYVADHLETSYTVVPNPQTHSKTNVATELSNAELKSANGCPLCSSSYSVKQVCGMHLLVMEMSLFVHQKSSHTSADYCALAKTEKQPLTPTILSRYSSEAILLLLLAVQSKVNLGLFHDCSPLVPNLRLSSPISKAHYL